MSQKNSKFKAIIFNGGKGRRLFPVIGRFMPKGHIFFGEKPLICYQLDALKKAGIGKVVVVLRSAKERSFLNRLAESGLVPSGLKIESIVTFLKQADSPYENFFFEEFYHIFEKKGILLLNSDHIFLSSDIKNILQKIKKDNNCSLVCLSREQLLNSPFDIKKKKIIGMKKSLDENPDNLAGISYFSPGCLEIIKELTHVPKCLLKIENLVAEMVKHKINNIQVHQLKFFINMNLPQDYRRVRKILAQNENFMLE